MSFLPVGTELGRLTLVRVYESYDIPRLFSCKNNIGTHFLAVWSDEDDEFDTWLYAPMSPKRFEQVETGGVPLFDAFSLVEDKVLYEVRTSKISESVHVISKTAESIDPTLLPLPGEHLALSQAPEIGVDLEYFKATARQINSEVIGVRLLLPNRLRTEAPAKVVGKVLESFQLSIDAIAQFLGGQATDRGMVPTDILGKSEMMVCRTYAGSFGIELHASESADLFGESDSHKVLKTFTQIIKSTDNKDAFLSRIQSVNNRSLAKLGVFFKNISTGITETTFDWGSVNEEDGGHFSISKEHAKNAVEYLSEFEELEPTEYTVQAVLIGINIRTKVYELQDSESNRKFTGKIAESAYEDAEHATVNQGYTALIREINEVTPVGETKISYRLLRLQPI